MRRFTMLSGSPVALGGSVSTLTRAPDHRQRLSTLALDGDTLATYFYDTENRLATVSNAAFVATYAYTHDILGRPTTRNADTFGYNHRSEVTSAAIGTNGYTYAYDEIGNLLSSAISAPPRETLYTANNLNQYLRVFAPSREAFPTYDPDGNLLTNGIFSYSWDAENRLVAAYSNSICVVSNAYDHMEGTISILANKPCRDEMPRVLFTNRPRRNLTRSSYIWEGIPSEIFYFC